MDTERHWNMRVRVLEEREHQFVLGLDDMTPEEMRWLVRYLADALTEERWRTLLAGYHESLPSDQVRHFLERLIHESTQLGILDLHAVRGRDPAGLQSLTDTDLQGMSAIEKWQMIAREPRGLDPFRMARELARLAFCLQPDLLHDAMLPRAAIEFAFYFRLLEALKHLPPSDLYCLVDEAAAILSQAERLSADEVAEGLASIHQKILHATGFTAPIQEHLGASMAQLPRQFFPPTLHEEVSPDRLTEQLRTLSPKELRLRLQIQADQLSLREFQQLLQPSRSQYANLGQMPIEALRQLVATLTVHLDGREVCDFIQRYRTGKFLAIPPVSGEVWNLLPQEDRMQLLERDNTGTDIAQMARHLAKILLSHEYQMLDNAESQAAIVLSPLYQDLVHRLTHLGEDQGEPKITTLNRDVTGLVLAMEQKPRERRAEDLKSIRQLIGDTLGLSERLAFPRV